MFEIMITEEEAQELLEFIYEKIGYPLVGRETTLINRVAKKISMMSQPRIIGECGRSGKEIFLDEEGKPEARTLKCDNPKCEYIWKSWFVQTDCPKCAKK